MSRAKLEALANLPQTLEKFTQEAVQRIGGFIDEGNASKAALLAAGSAAALAPQEAEAGMLDKGLALLRKEIAGSGRSVSDERAINRGVREVASKTQALSAAEKAAVKEAVRAAGGSLKEGMAAARDIKNRFPSRDVTDTAWSPIQITGMKIETNSKGVTTYKPILQKQSYKFHIDPATGKQAKKGSPHYQKMVDGVSNEIIEIARRAEQGDESALKIMDNAGWYKNVENRGFNEYGSFYDMFGDLLGATSPNTPVATNFKFSKDILTRATRGEFDVAMDGFADLLDEVEVLKNKNLAIESVASSTDGMTVSAAKKSAEYIANKNRIKEANGSIEQITQTNGKLYGINSTNAMIALADRWRVFRAGSAPKAKNFSGNLVGFSIKPTIDVWSARNLRRHSGQSPIPSPAETGVTGQVVDIDNFVNNLEFGYGQDVLTDATQKINAELGLNLEPRDLQALQWFAEKEIWSIKGWTNAAGEGGSFETMMDNSPVEALIVGTSRAQSLENQSKNFIPGAGDQLEVAREIQRLASADPDVVASKAPTTMGLYGSDVEVAFDIDIVSKRDMLPVDALDQVAVQAVDDAQDSFFVARRIEPSVANQNPGSFSVGMETYFKNPVSPDGDTIKQLQQHLNDEGVQGFTLIVDPRKKPGAMADQVIGVRFLDIPQFTGDAKFAKMSSQEFQQYTAETYGEYNRIGAELQEIFPEIRTAQPSYFDINVKSKGEAGDYVAQLQANPASTDTLREEFWKYRPAQERITKWYGQDGTPNSSVSSGTSQSGYATPQALALLAPVGAGLAMLAGAPAPAEAGPINIVDPISGAIRKGIEAYHGTGAKFPPTANNPLGEFDDAFMGTGEGAQAYSRGHYQADSEDVAKGYRADEAQLSPFTAERGMATPAALAATAAAGGAGMAMMGQDANAGMASIPPALDLSDIPFTNQPAIPRPEEVMAAEVNEQMQEGRRSGEKFTQLMSGNRSDRSGFFAQAEALLGTVNGAIGQGLEFVGEAAAIPVRGVLGLTGAASELAQGNGMDAAMQRGAVEVNKPMAQQFDDVLMPFADAGSRSLFSMGGAVVDAAQGESPRTIINNMGQAINTDSGEQANRLGEYVTDELTAVGLPPRAAAGAGALAFGGSQLISPL